MLTLRALADAQICELYIRDMQRDFPPSELKSLQSIRNLCALGVYDVLGAFEGDVLAGYALVYRPKQSGMLLLDYLAVLPAHRGKGIGKALLEAVKAYYKNAADCLLIECERPKAAPDEAEARRRIRFYQQVGAVLTDVRIWLFDVEYSILVLPCMGKCVPEGVDWAGQMLALYRQMLPEELYARFVRLIRG